MKLFSSGASPYVRKVRIVLREKGLADRVEEIPTVALDSPPDLTAANPLAQIPALIDENGVAWRDSGLISAWLDTQGSGPALLPEPGSEAYWSVRRMETAGTGLLEMALKLVQEGRRPEAERSAFWTERWHENLMRGFVQAETLRPDPEVLDMGTLTLAVAATYCDFRMPDLGWQAEAPQIAALQARLEARPSFRETYPA